MRPRTTHYIIESDIPIPQVKFRRTLNLEGMKIGDSMLVPTNNKAKAVLNRLRTLGWKGAMRRSQGKYRVWRIE